MTEATYGLKPTRIFDDRALSQLARSSVTLIAELQDESGAYPASPTFSAYKGYSWFRDGAFVADAMSAAGQVDSASRFFDWCSRILLTREAQITQIVDRSRAGDPVPDSEMLATRFTFAGESGDDDWWDFQLDGYGTWLWAVVEHAGRHEIDSARWRRAIELTTDYLVASWSRPCFDWWEENEDQVHVSTLGCIAAGLDAASTVVDPERAKKAKDAANDIRIAIRAAGLTNGHLAKWVGSDQVDASALSLISPLSVFGPADPLVAETISAISEQLVVDGGVHRYRADTFFGGGQWPLLTCFLGLALAAAGDYEGAMKQLKWAASTADDDGCLPEQVPWDLLDETRQQEWVERWGPVASPLLWSHGMYIRLAVELGLMKAVK